jgi:hypothetical protein
VVQRQWEKDVCVNSSRRNQKLRAELLSLRLSLSIPAATLPLLDESKVDDAQLSPPRSTVLSQSSTPPSRLATLGHHINELRAKAIIIRAENKHRSNSAVSSHLATGQKETVSKLQADRVSLPHSLSSGLAALALRLLATSRRAPPPLAVQSFKHRSLIPIELRALLRFFSQCPLE